MEHLSDSKTENKTIDLNYNFLANTVKNKFNKNDIPTHLSAYMQSNNKFISLSDSLIYKYNDGIYKKYSDMIDSDIHMTFINLSNQNKFFATTQVINETIYRISRETRKDPQNIECDKNLVCLKNKILDVRTGIVEDHTPDKVFFNKLPITYDPSAKCPKFDKFLHEVLSDKDAKTIYELFGYLLYRGYPIEKAFMFIGEGKNGKSTLIQVMNMFIGAENVSNISIQDLCNDRFAAANLHGKLLNTYPDLKEDGLTDTAIFKAVTSGKDSIQVDVKGKERITFINYAKLVFSCNRTPIPTDSSYAYLRRWIAIRFNNKFEGKKDNKNLIHEITTETELSGILNKAVESLKVIMKNGDFSDSNMMEDISKIFTPVKYFVDKKCFISFNDRIKKGLLYIKFKEFCASNNVTPMTDKMFCKALKEYVNVGEGREGSSEAWLGIRLKTQKDEIYKTPEEEDMERLQQLLFDKEGELGGPEGY